MENANAVAMSIPKSVELRMAQDDEEILNHSEHSKYLSLVDGQLYLSYSLANTLLTMVALWIDIHTR